MSDKTFAIRERSQRNNWSSIPKDHYDELGLETGSQIDMFFKRIYARHSELLSVLLHRTIGIGNPETSCGAEHESLRQVATQIHV